LNFFKELTDKYHNLKPIGQSMADSAELLIDCFKNGGKLLICGNGGSAADCEHIVGELMKGFVLRRELSAELQSKMKEIFPADSEYLINNLQQGLPAISLVSHTALMTAFANDNTAELCFAQQVLGYGKQGDILLAISTSGNSKNVLYAAKTAKVLGIKVIALTGKTGGKLKDVCDVLVNVHETETYKIQELHLPYYHALCLSVEDYFFGESK
jgi:D-sedoheptulose 7-phosphate isomerase